MIAVESFKRFRKDDFIVISIFILLFFILNFFIRFAGEKYSFMISALILIMFMSSIALILRKFGSVIMFNIFVSLISILLKIEIPSINLLGVYNLIVLVIAGIVFEGIFLMLKLEINNVPIDIIIVSAFAMASIPLSTGLLYSIEITMQMISKMTNLVLLYFLIGIIGSILSFLIWYEIKNEKFIIKFEYHH